MKTLSQATTFERRVNSELCRIQGELACKYDFSKETARALGVKRPLDAFSKNGDSKTGGVMLDGSAAVNRYLAINVIDGKVTLVAQLMRGATIAEGWWYVEFPESQRALVDGQEISYPWGHPAVIFPDSEKELAWALYGKLVDLYVPKLKQGA